MTDEHALETAFRDWLAAIPRKDLDFFRRTIADEWVYTDYTGHVHDKAEYLKLIEELISPDHETELVEIEVKPYGDTARVVGRYTSVGTLANGKRSVQDSRFTAMWVSRDGRWQSVARQAGNIGEALF